MSDPNVCPHGVVWSMLHGRFLCDECNLSPEIRQLIDSKHQRIAELETLNGLLKATNESDLRMLRATESALGLATVAKEKAEAEAALMREVLVAVKAARDQTEWTHEDAYRTLMKDQPNEVFGWVEDVLASTTNASTWLAGREESIRRECCPCNCHEEWAALVHDNCKQCREAVKAEREQIEDALAAAAERRGLERAAEVAEDYGQLWGESAQTQIRADSSTVPSVEIAKAIRALAPGGEKVETASILRARLGFTPLTNEQQQRNLDHNLAQTVRECGRRIVPEGPGSYKCKICPEHHELYGQSWNGTAKPEDK